MARSGVLKVRIIGDPGPLQNTLGNLGSKVKRFAKIAAAAGATAAAGFGVKAVKAASDLNETLSKSNTIFGKNAKAIEVWGEQAATSIGQSKQQALESAATFGNLFDQLGFAEDATADMSTQMVELASDFASFHNADVTQVLEAQTAAFRGEFDAVQRFVPTISAAAVQQKALEMGLAATSDELTQQQKALATQTLLVEGAGEAAGDFGRTSGSLANRVRILRSRFENFAAEFGMKLIPFVQRGLDLFERGVDILTVFARIIRAAATKNAQEAHKAFKQLNPSLHDAAQFVFDVTGAVRDAWPQIKEMGTQALETARGIGKVLLPVLREVIIRGFRVLTSAVKTLIANKEVLIPLIGAVAGGYAAYKTIQGTIAAITAAQKAWTAAQAAFNVVMAANPIGIVVVGLAALTAGIVTAWKTSERFRNTVKGAWQAIRNATSGLVNAVVGGLGWIVDKMLWAAETIITAAADAFSWVPGLGPKLARARDRVKQFRSEVNRELSRIRRNVDVNIRGRTNLFALTERIRRETGFAVSARDPRTGQVVGTGIAMQRGALFPPRTPTFGIIGEGPHREVAAPEPMLRQVVREESGGGPIVVKVMLNEHELGEALVSVNRRRQKRGLVSVS